MSTKIHNGWRYTPDSGHADPFELAGKFRDTVAEAVHTARLARTVELAVDIHDGVHRSATGAPSGSPMLAAERYLADAASKIRETGHRDPANDFSCEIVMLRDGDRCDTLYLLTYAEVDLTAALESIEGVSEFVYWTNVDPLENVDPDDWGDRGNTWERVLGWDPPGERGVRWGIGEQSFGWATQPPDVRAATIDPLIPTRRERATRIAVTAALDALVIDRDARPAAIMAHVDEVRAEVLADTASIDAIADTLEEIDHTYLVQERRR